MRIPSLSPCVQSRLGNCVLLLATLFFSVLALPWDHLLVAQQRLQSNSKQIDPVVLASGRTLRAPSPTIAQMYHRAWTTRDGLPDSIWQLTQSSDGFLWIASASGLYRFDGITFKHYSVAEHHLLSDTVTAVYGTRDGGLWIGYGFGGVSFLKDGVVTNFAAQENGLNGVIPCIVQRPDGEVWACTKRGVMYLSGNSWRPLESGYQLQPGPVRTMSADREGGLWVSAGNTLQYLAKGSRRFTQVAPLGGAVVASGGVGHYWAANCGDLYELSSSKDGVWTARPAKFGTGILYPAVDSVGDLWFGSVTQGVSRVSSYLLQNGLPFPALRDTYATRQGLTSDSPYQVFPDREGGVWVVTMKGLDYFRRMQFTPVEMPLGTSGISLVGLEDGSALIGAAAQGSEPWLQVNSDGTSFVKRPAGNVTCLYLDPRGDLWAGVGSRVIRWSQGKFESFAIPKNPANPFREVQAMAMDKSGALWVAVTGEAPYSLHEGQWQQASWWNGAPHSHPLSILSRSDGSVWFGSDNLVITVTAQTVHQFDSRNGLHVGKITTMEESGDHVWIAGVNGLQFVRGGVIHDLQMQGNPQLRGVSGVVERKNGDLWLNTGAGAVRISSEDVKRALEDPIYPVRLSLYDYLEGFPGTPMMVRPLPTLIEARDGRLYFAGRDAVAWVDPNRLLSNGIAPGVSIDSLTVDGQPVAASGVATLKKKPESVIFDFAAGTLYLPEKERIRYRLEGFDSEWQEAAGRRQAVYPKLPPGNYTFYVSVTNSSGVASQADASFSFRIPPTFLQSRKFGVLALGLGCFALWSLYRLRLRYVTQLMRRRYDERHREREILARELHDNFFPGVQGLFLRVSSARGRLRLDEPERERLEEILVQSDQVMLEGRDLIFKLRTRESLARNLAGEVERVGREFEVIHGVVFEEKVLGDPLTLEEGAADEVFQIAKEALWNAFRHSHATKISAEIVFGRHELLLSVCDNGIGIDADVLIQGGREGHWGLLGLRERARALKARLRINSTAKSGTCVSIYVPGSVVYESEASWWSALRTFVEAKLLRKSNI